MLERSWLDFAGSGLYLVTALLCLLAAWNQSQVANNKKEYLLWLVLSGFFVMLALSRLWQIETQISEWLKADLIASGAYGSRKSMQGLVVGGVLLGAIGLAVGIARKPMLRKTHGFNPLIYANLAALGMSTLVILRIISLHAIDQILFTWRLNWVLDPGLTLFVATMASMSIIRSRKRLNQS